MGKSYLATSCRLLAELGVYGSFRACFFSGVRCFHLTYTNVALQRCKENQELPEVAGEAGYCCFQNQRKKQYIDEGLIATKTHSFFNSSNRPSLQYHFTSSASWILASRKYLNTKGSHAYRKMGGNTPLTLKGITHHW